MPRPQGQLPKESCGAEKDFPGPFAGHRYRHERQAENAHGLINPDFLGQIIFNP